MRCEINDYWVFLNQWSSFRRRHCLNCHHCPGVRSATGVKWIVRGRSWRCRWTRVWRTVRRSPSPGRAPRSRGSNLEISSSSSTRRHMHSSKGMGRCCTNCICIYLLYAMHLLSTFVFGICSSIICISDFFIHNFLQDLIMKMDISLTEALTGLKKAVKTLDERTLVIQTVRGGYSEF